MILSATIKTQPRPNHIIIKHPILPSSLRIITAIMKIIAAALALLCMSSAHAAGPVRKRLQTQHRSLTNSKVKINGMFAPVFDMERRLSMSTPSAVSMPSGSMPDSADATATTDETTGSTADGTDDGTKSIDGALAESSG